jgi:hypothetical protein
LLKARKNGTYTAAADDDDVMAHLFWFRECRWFGCCTSSYECIIFGCKKQ